MCPQQNTWKFHYFQNSIEKKTRRVRDLCHSPKFIINISLPVKKKLKKSLLRAHI